MKLIGRLLLLTLFVAANLPVVGQTRLKALVSSIDNISKQRPVEKLYLQTDKAGYVQGDTIWFKAYLLEADHLKPSARSGLLYAELDDSENICVKRMLLSVANGLTWGNMALNEDEVPEGNYTLRAYTNWMRNFGEDYVFSKNIYIASSADRSKLVVAGFKQDGNNILANILLTNLNREPLRLQDQQVQVLNGRHILYKKNIATGIDGRLDVNFTIPDNIPAKNLSVTATEIIKGQRSAAVIIPVIINRPENTDLQFMPEGGALVDGIAAKIGFKAVGEDGKGVHVSGKVYDSKKQEVAVFSAAHRGIGAFELTPHAGEHYIATVRLPNGASKNYPLPAVNANGTTLQVIKSSDDSVRIRIVAKTLVHGDYCLVGQSGGGVCYGEHIITKHGIALTNISRDLFPTGIARFTLLNAANQPLNERIIYVSHDDNLRVSVIPDRQKYKLHDSIAVQLLVTGKDGTPVSGAFSMAVTDDNQVKTDSLGDNIINNLLFTADLKGYVEDAGYYFSSSSAECEAELDNLLLTQGWVGYSWKQVFDTPEPPLYAAQKQFEITGRVSNAFNKPVERSGITLLSKKPVMAMDTITGKDGRFVFSGLFPVDTASYFLQARRKSGSSFNIRLDVDEFTPPIFKQATWRTIPWYVNSDTLLLQNRNNKISQRLAEGEILGHGKMLKEVIIKDKRIIKESKNLNGPGEADYILDEKDMAKAGRMTLLELLDARFPHIEMTMPHTGLMVYRLKSHIINFFIDGRDIRMLDLDPDLYLHYLTAEDIKGVEVMYTSNYAMRYDPDFLKKQAGPDRGIPVYLEITTRSGHGALWKKTQVTYRYKPMPISVPKEFYQPRYTVKSTPNGTDQRSTIHWSPDIVTDTAGKALVTFYSADKPAGYTIIVQGADLNGHLGFAWKRVTVH